MKDIKRIGTVSISYHTDGKVKDITFKPMDYSVSPTELCKELMKSDYICNPPSEHVLKQTAENVLAHYFSQLNTIELADRDEYQIQTTIGKLNKFENGTVSDCEIILDFVKL